MLYFEQAITGIDNSTATLTGYVIDNSPEIVADRRRPAVVIFPGGAYKGTSDREAEPVAMKMIGFGFHAFVLRYSVEPSQYPVALIEAAQTVQMIRKNADTWHVDPNAIVVMGFSAGGYLAACLGTMCDKKTLREHGYDLLLARPNGLALSYPVITSGTFAHRESINTLLGERSNDPELLRQVSLEYQVDNDTPPTFIWHTETDDLVPVQNTTAFVDALCAHHVPVEAHLYPTGKHGLSLGTAETVGQDASTIEECVQTWPELFRLWMRRRFPSQQECSSGTRTMAS